MNCAEGMTLLSQYGLGALLLDRNDIIQAVNSAGDALLRGDGRLAGRPLAEIAPLLGKPAGYEAYSNPAFGEYLLRCPAPEIDDLPQGGRLVVFRSVTDRVYLDMLLNVINNISESVIVCDAESRICFLNDAAVKMDSIVTGDVEGDKISSVYFDQENSELQIPSVIRDRTPRLNVRQHYSTRYGKDVDIMTNSFPILERGQVLGGFSVMEDWSTVDSLHKQIIDLQEKLLSRQPPSGRAGGKSALVAKYRFSDIIHVSRAMGDVVAHCKRVAKSDSSVMIYGETGTGKELFAQSIHNASNRAKGPFLAINCAALPENLLEGLLFGTEKGAYTGAETRAGLFEQANHGTLLLDEINSMNITLQAKLLRVLQDGVVRRVGGVSETQVDVRVLSNINIPPHQAIAEKKLRQDLFYRLGVINVNIPPLRERREDIPLLVKSFIMQYNKKLGRNVRDIDADALEKCYDYPWPGNVRELQHVIEHAMNVLSKEDSAISAAHIYTLPRESPPPELPPAPVGTAVYGGSLNSRMQEMERAAICNVLKLCGGNISKAADILKMSRQNLQYRIKRYKIDVDELKRELYRNIGF